MAAPKAPRSFPSITCIGSCRISASIWVQTGEFVMPPDKRICFGDVWCRSVSQCGSRRKKDSLINSQKNIRGGMAAVEIEKAPLASGTELEA